MKLPSVRARGQLLYFPFARAHTQCFTRFPRFLACAAMSSGSVDQAAYLELVGLGQVRAVATNTIVDDAWKAPVPKFTLEVDHVTHPTRLCFSSLTAALHCRTCRS